MNKQLEELAQPVAWPNGCNNSAVAALRYLAEKPRPAGGNSAYNTEHLYMIAGELTRMSSQKLYSQEYVTALQQRIAELERRLATPVRLTECWDVSGQVNPPRIVQVQFEQQNRTRNQCAEAIRAAGFKVDGDA